jgi:aminopeptidase N
LFDRAPNELTLAHEIAHQWYGDDVTLRHWRDIWLNEGFAEFSAWLWDEHRGRMSAAQHLDQLMSLPPSSGIWNPPPGNPGDAAHIFSGSVYERGAGTLQALREKVGDTVFFRIMRGWVAAHRYGNATVSSFISFAEGVAGRDLTTFFHEWLYRVGKPYSAASAAYSPAAIERR